MAEYIEREPFVRGLTAMKRVYDAISLDGMIKALQEATAADVVEVVRCKQCQHMFEKGWCSLHNTPMSREDFCSYGEKKK